MKFLVNCCCLLLLISQSCFARFDFIEIKLTGYENLEFSGLARSPNGVFFISQIQKGKPARIYYAADDTLKKAISQGRLGSLDAFTILGLDTSKSYDGIEAVVVRGDILYFAIETKNDTSCYIRKGTIDWREKIIQIDPNFNVPLAKLAGTVKGNEGFESLALIDSNTLLTIFEEGTKTVQGYTIHLNNSNKAQRISVKNHSNNGFTFKDAFVYGDRLYALYFCHKNNGTDMTKIISCDKSQLSQGNWSEVCTFTSDNTAWEGLCMLDTGYLVISDDGPCEEISRCQLQLRYIYQSADKKTPPKDVPAVPQPSKGKELKDWKTISSVKGNKNRNYVPSKTLTLTSRTLIIDEAVANRVSLSDDTVIRCSYELVHERLFELKEGYTSVSDTMRIKNIRWFYVSKSGVELEIIKDTFYRVFPGEIEIKNRNGKKDLLKSYWSKDTSIGSKRGLRKLYEQSLFDANTKFVCFGINYMPGVAYRNVRVYATQLQEQKVLLDRDKETSIFGQAFGAFIGVTTTKASAISLEYLHIRQGFKMDSMKHDWRTGKDTSDVNAHEYRLINQGFGLVYQYSGYGYKQFKLAAEVGFYSLWTSMYADNSVAVFKKDQLKSAGLRLHNFVGKVGLGLNWHPDYMYEIRLVPIVYYNFKSSSRGSVLRENLFNIGLNIGLMLRL